MWDLVNIAVPIVLTPLAMLIVIAGKSSDSRYVKNGHFMTVIKDGQMGFLTVPMAAAMVMDMLGHAVTVELALALALALAAIALVTCAIGGAFVAALCAVYTAERDSAPKRLLAKARHYAFMWQSLLFVTLAALVTHYARWHLLR